MTKESLFHMCDTIRIIPANAQFSLYFPEYLFLQIPILMSLLYHNDTIIKKEKELLRALLIQFCKLEFLDAYNMRKKLNFILNIVLSFTAIL